MRKVLAFLLLASASTPALAAADPGDTIRAHANREARQEARSEARSERSGGNDHSNGGGNDRSNSDGNHSGGNDRPHTGGNPDGSRNGGNGPQQPVVHIESGGGGGNQAGERRSHHGFGNRVSSGDERPAIQPSGRDDGKPSDTVRGWRGPKVVEPTHVTTEDRVAPTLRRQDRPLPGVFRDRVPIVSNVPHEGTQPPLRVDNRSRDRNHHWDTSWRNNHRYDWKDWRRRHRSHFHLGFYYDPFGWSYRPYSIGWRLWPSYFSSRYWISDPWQYRLPYAPPGYRWIRYWDDAVLVDTWDGRVVDVIHNFFW